MMAAWCVVTGKGSGLYLYQLHRVDTDKSFGEMQTFCGVIISAAFEEHHPRPWNLCKACRRVLERREREA